MSYKLKLRPQVRLSSFKHLPGRKFCLRPALAKFSVLLTLLFLLGVTATGDIFAAPLKHNQQTKETNHAVYLPLANTPGSSSKAEQRGRTVKVHTGAFAPASLANPLLEKSSRKVQTGVFGAAIETANRAPVQSGENPALVGLFDLASEG